jgi:hypothetical protein
LAWLLATLPTERSNAVVPPAVDDGGLRNVYLDQTYEVTSEACSRRFPDMASSLGPGLKAWRTRHATSLAEMLGISQALHAASLSSPPINGLLAPDRLAQLGRLQRDEELRLLASSVDHDARRFCEKRLADLNDNDWTELLFMRARATAKDLLAQKRQHTEDFLRRQRQAP